MTQPSEEALETGSAEEAALAGEARSRRLPLDTRLRREVAQRRLAVSLVRRVLRVVSLHLLDGALVAGVVALLAASWSSFEPVQPFVLTIVGAFLLSLNAVAAYNPGDARRDRRRFLYGSLVATLILACLAIFPPHLPFSPPLLILLGGFGFAAVALGRKLVDQVVRFAYAHGLGLRRAVIVGNLDQVGGALRALRDDRNVDQFVVGHVTASEEPDPAALGVLDDLPRLVAEVDVQEVIVATTLPARTLRQVAEVCFENGVALYVIPSVIGKIQGWAEPVKLGACPALHLHPARLEMPALVLKRLFDLVVAVIVLPLLAPLMAAIALGIKLDSPGPVFFRQERMGLGGRRFTIWKFRSMRLDAEERRRDLHHLNAYGCEHLFKVKDDPRITRMGRFLRRTSLDELPQLFNVFTGDMSLVGPRPPLACEVALYELHHFDRLSVVPGITGPWQVGGRNLVTEFERVVEIERDYIRSWSLLLDAKILFRTIGVVVRGEGAY
ncbi:MAG: sugar transferase [Longimicrobiaceae bacterium]